MGERYLTSLPCWLTVSKQLTLKLRLTYLIKILPANNALQSTMAAHLLLLWITWLMTDSLSVSSEVIFQLIKSLNPHKAHGQDEIFVKMLKLCVPLVSKPRAALCLDTFLMSEKKVIVFDSIKNGINKNYRPVSLLPIWGKSLEELRFNSIFNFGNVRKMLSSHQSGLRLGCFLHTSTRFDYSWNLQYFWCKS